MSDRCKGCGAEIRWIKTTNGKAMPVDPDPLSIIPGQFGSTVVVTEDGRTFLGQSGIYIDARTTPGAIEGFTSHFATCPAARSFRKKGGRDT